MARSKSTPIRNNRQAVFTPHKKNKKKNNKKDGAGATTTTVAQVAKAPRKLGFRTSELNSIRKAQRNTNLHLPFAGMQRLVRGALADHVQGCRVSFNAFQAIQQCFENVLGDVMEIAQEIAISAKGGEQRILLGKRAQNEKKSKRFHPLPHVMPHHVIGAFNLILKQAAQDSERFTWVKRASDKLEQTEIAKLVQLPPPIEGGVPLSHYARPFFVIATKEQLQDKYKGQLRLE